MKQKLHELEKYSAKFVGGNRNVFKFYYLFPKVLFAAL